MKTLVVYIPNLLYVPPVLVIENIIYRVFVDFEHFRHVFSCNFKPKIPYFNNIFSFKFMEAVFSKGMSPLIHRISFVVNTCSYEKMFRIHTYRIITAMKNEFSFWYISVVKNPRISVREHIPTIYRKLPIMVTSKSASSPFPAIRSLFNVLKESFMWRFTGMTRPAGLSHGIFINFISAFRAWSFVSHINEIITYG